MDQAKVLYAETCPIVKASVGQHIRHSMDHLELAAQAVVSTTNPTELHYDLRARGGADEHDIDEAYQRVQSVIDNLTKFSSVETPQLENNEVQAYFMLSGDPTEFQLPSTVERELGFAAHHAIHHMAMVKIIAVETLGIPGEDLSPDFGRAPSTIVYHKTFEQSQ